MRPNGDGSDTVLLDQVRMLQQQVEALKSEIERSRHSVNVSTIRDREDFSMHLDIPATYVNQFSCQSVRAGMLRIMFEETVDDYRVASRAAFVTDVGSAKALAELLLNQVRAVLEVTKLAETPVGVAN